MSIPTVLYLYPYPWARACTCTHNPYPWSCTRIRIPKATFTRICVSGAQHNFLNCFVLWCCGGKGGWKIRNWNMAKFPHVYHFFLVSTIHSAPPTSVLTCNKLDLNLAYYVKKKQKQKNKKQKNKKKTLHLTTSVFIYRNLITNLVQKC